MSSFSLSKILPIIVPAAAVAIGCWWYYFRKKKANQRKPEAATHPVALANLNSFEPTEDKVRIKAWSLHHGSSMQNSYLQLDSSTDLDMPSLTSDLNGSSGDAFASEKIENGEICLLQQTTKCEALHASPTRRVLGRHKEPVPADTCFEHEDLVHNDLHLEDSPRHQIPTENTNIPELQRSNAEYQHIKADTDHLQEQEVLSKTLALVESEVIERDAYKDELSPIEAMQIMVSIKESQMDDFPVMENQKSSIQHREPSAEVCSEDHETLTATECIESERMDSKASMGAENMAKSGGFPHPLKVSSSAEFQICHTCTDDTSNKRFLGNYEAKMVEELAINIISKVIVAAKQELLASAVRNLSDGDYLESDECTSERSMPLVLEQNTATSLEESDSFSTRDSASESTQTEQNQVDDLRDLNGKEQVCLEENTECECGDQKADPSPVLVCTDSFDEGHAAIDDSSMSACTSEDGVGIEDPLQSTVMSSIGIGSYDSLSTSGIELSRDQISVRKKKAKKDKAARKNLLVNGHSNGSSLDLKEGASFSETEIDHTGSDQNGMDLSDSASTSGTAEQHPNRAVSKNIPVVWEFEVPKHLVGRLIGKQGRFVTYLKETSGAKIYITTLPFTQEFQLCHIEGSQEAVDIALDLISKKFRDLDLTNFYQPPLLQRQGSLPTTSWLVLPEGVTIEVAVSSIASATHLFIQQHTHPTYHALGTLDQQMYFCYMEPGIPTLPTPVEVGTICAAPNENNEWWRAQVVSYFPNTEEVFIRYVDYGGYKRVKIKTLRQIRSDFVTLPFQGTEVLLDNITPIHGDNTFNTEAIEAVGEMLNGVPLYAQVTNYDLATKIQMIQLWAMMGGEDCTEAVSINTLIVERGYARWQDSY